MQARLELPFKAECADTTPRAMRLWSRLVAWFSSPFWVGAHQVSPLFVGQAGGPPGAGHPLASAEMPSGEFAQPAGRGKGRTDDPLALCDAFLECTDASAETVVPNHQFAQLATRVYFESGAVESLDSLALMELLVRASLERCFPPQALKWIAQNRFSWVDGHGMTPLVTVPCLLPSYEGRLLRSELLHADQIAVPAGAYPLTALLLPEVSYRLIPIAMSAGQWLERPVVDTVTQSGEMGSVPRGYVGAQRATSLPLTAWRTAMHCSWAPGLLRRASMTPAAIVARRWAVQRRIVKPGLGERLLKRLETNMTNPF